MPISKNISLIAMLFAMLLSNQSTFAQSSTWNGGGGANNKFTDPVNWSSGVPGSNGTAFFSLGSTYDVFVNDDVNMSRLSIGVGEIKFFGGNQLFFANGATLSNDATVQIQEANTHFVSEGTLFHLQDESLLRVTEDAFLEVKNNAGNARLLLSNDSNLFVSNGRIDADIIHSGDATDPTGYIQLDTGAIVDSQDVRIAQIPAADCGVLVFGNGTKWTSDVYRVGVNGTGDVILQNGGNVDANETVVAENSGSDGRILVIANGSLWETNQLSLGRSGSGLLQLSGGGDFLAADIVVGENPSGTGAIEIAGNGSQLSVTGSLQIGDLGTGTYTQDVGTTVVDGLTTIGSGSSFAMRNATFTSGGLNNSGTMDFMSGFANLQTDVEIENGGLVQVTTSGPVNFLQDLQHNGAEMFISASRRVNVFGGYSGNGDITGTGVIHFKGTVDPGVNFSTLEFGSISSEGDVVLENTAQLNIRLDGSNLNSSDIMLVEGSVDLQSPQLNVSLSNGNQIQDGEEFVILKNAGGLTGTFQGHAEGAVVADFGNVRFLITYSGGAGSDVCLVADVEPTTFELVASSFSAFRGVQIGGNLASIQQADDSHLRFNPGFTLNPNEAPVWVVFDATLPTDSPTDLKMFYEAHANTPGLELTVESFNWNTNSYDVLDSFAASFNTDENVGIVISGQPEYVEAGTGNVRARIGWRRTGFTIVFPWEVGIDWMGWTGG